MKLSKDDLIQLILEEVEQQKEKPAEDRQETDVQAVANLLPRIDNMKEFMQALSIMLKHGRTLPNEQAVENYLRNLGRKLASIK